MKIKTSELTGAALNWMVAKCEGAENLYSDGISHYFLIGSVIRVLGGRSSIGYAPSANWSQGGPIVERERIELQWHITPEHRSGEWFAVTEYLSADDALYRYGADSGPTPLIAAMRCYVASKLGDDVEIPEVLL